LTNGTAQRAELIGGQTFTRPERTPLLRSIIDRANGALHVAVRSVAPAAHVRRDGDVLLSSHAVVIPDIAVYCGATWDVPDLVVEYRAESTDRLFFGPKRLAYARARVPEVWFVDVSKATVTVLRLSDALDYPWPAEIRASGETIASSSIPGVAVRVDALLRSAESSFRMSP
jgi:Uma2 family endonuclease